MGQIGLYTGALINRISTRLSRDLSSFWHSTMCSMPMIFKEACILRLQEKNIVMHKQCNQVPPLQEAFTPLQLRRIRKVPQIRAGFLTGFTFIELLVVIAIIALLMAILMPALRRLKKQAKAVACQSNLKQWSLIWAMYTEDNNGYFPGRVWVWQQEVRDYYTDPKICLCPTATKLYSEGGRAPFGAWSWTDNTGKILSGSLGINQWILNPQGTNTEGRRVPAYLWRTPNVTGTGNIPVFLDCAITGATVWPEDTPPEFDGQFWVQGQGGSIDEMRRFCVNRHDGFVNILFMDWTVRKVGLKQLWTFKWHREYDTAGPWTTVGSVQPQDWPEWMRSFKDY